MTIHDCQLNGVSLSGIDTRICVLDIQEDAPEMVRTVHPLSRGGQRVRQQRRSLTVRVQFAIHETVPSRRKAILQSIAAWAQPGGFLTVEDRPGKRLPVICTALPAMTAEDWTSPLTLTFTTTHCPWWESQTPTTVSGSNTLTLTVPGSADFTPVDAEITNTGSQPITLLSIQCGDSYMFFSGIDLPAGETLYLTTEDGVFSAKIGDESVLAKRSTTSDDLLLAPCGKACDLLVSTTGTIRAAFSARGRYA